MYVGRIIIALLLTLKPSSRKLYISNNVQLDWKPWSCSGDESPLKVDGDGTAMVNAVQRIITTTAFARGTGSGVRSLLKRETHKWYSKRRRHVWPPLPRAERPLPRHRYGGEGGKKIKIIFRMPTDAAGIR